MGKLGSSSILLRQHKVNISCPILSDHLTLIETANAYLKDKNGYRLGGCSNQKWCQHILKSKLSLKITLLIHSTFLNFLQQEAIHTLKKEAPEIYMFKILKLSLL